jgi:hypothetical protein
MRDREMTAALIKAEEEHLAYRRFRIGLAHIFAMPQRLEKR